MRAFPAVVVALALLLPAMFLAVYRRAFGFDPLIVVFGEAAVLFLAAVVGLLALGPGSRRGRTWLVATVTAILALSGALVFSGAAISNAVWGDTLNYGIVHAFLGHPRAVFAFLPLPPGERDLILAAIAAAVAIVFGGFALAVAWGAARLLGGLHRAHPSRRRIGSALLGLAAIAGGTALAIAILAPRALQGEPITGFLGLVPASNMLALDNARVAAAIEDDAARRAYQVPAGFTPRNVIVIFSDALRADHMGVYGYERETTPFLSRLFADDRLHRVDMALSSCSESFCGIATTFASRPYFQVSNDSFKLPSLLRDLGYRTMFFLSGEHRSWTYLFDFYGDDIDEIYDYQSLGASNPSDDRMLLDAVDDLPAADAKPRFLYFFLSSTHIEGARQPEFDRWRPSETDLSSIATYWNELAGSHRLPEEGMTPGRLAPEDIAVITNRYDNGVLQADAYVAHIFAGLEAKGYLRDAVVVVLADHGDGLGEHGHVGHTRYLYQEDIHIPLLVYGDGIARLRNDAFATQIDVAPTILDLLGLPIPAGWQGVSLVEPPGDRLTVHQTRRGNAPCFAVVERSNGELWKYMRCGAGPGNELLFDLGADPGERDNRIATAPADRLARYRAAVDERFGIVVNRCSRFECVD